MKLIDYPRYVSESIYAEEMEHMVTRLKKVDGLKAVYQVGSISTPGVSDIDLFVIFKDGVKCDFNALSGLSENGSYLFNHGPFAATTSQMAGVSRYTFFHNYRFIWGDTSLPAVEELSLDDVKELKFQTAIEYLLKMYINMTVERIFGIIKIRGLLLHVKALLYDLEFLGVQEGDVYDRLVEIVEMRNDWFSKTPHREAITKWHDAFYFSLEKFLGDILEKKSMYLPAQANRKLSLNIQLKPSRRFKCTHYGLTLPSAFGGISKKYFNLQYRFNRFVFDIPVTERSPRNVVAERHDFLADVQATNKRLLPAFLLPGTSLAIFQE